MAGGAAYCPDGGAVDVPPQDEIVYSQNPSDAVKTALDRVGWRIPDGRNPVRALLTLQGPGGSDAALG